MVNEELARLVSNSLFLAEPCMEPVPVLVQFRHEVVFWNQLGIATFGADSIVEALHAVFGTVSVFTAIAKNKSARIWLKSLEEEDIGQE